MPRFKPLAILSILLALLPACSHHTPAPSPATAQFPFQDPALSMKDRASDLVARMTLTEKIAQMRMDAPAIDRLGVPAYHWWNEGLHGVARNGAATVFPQAIGMAAAWNPALHHEMAQTIAIEARAKHQEALRNDRHGINTGLDLWSPNINIFRDPRWGRGQETYGEDPYLTSRLAVAYVTGIQGDDPVYFQAIATPKHFAVHSGPELERHRINNQVSNRDLYGTYLPAFEAAVREGNAYSVMGAYNRLNGVPCCCNPLLLTTILRDKWGFKGYVVSDVGAISDIYLNHQFVGTAEEAAALSVKAGCDLDGGTVYDSLQGAVQLGLIKPAEIDTAVTRLMLARLRLGEFDIPAKCPYANTPYDANDSPAHDQLAREVARQSMVLLKNQNHLLPLSKSLRTLAVIGPTADSVPVLLGNYNGTPSHPVTILQGIRNALPPTAQVLYEPGSPLVTEVLPLEELVPAKCLFTGDALQNPGLKANYYKEGALAGRPFRTRIDFTVDFDWSLQSPRDPIPGTENFSAVWTGYLVPPSSGTYQLGIQGAGAFRIYLDDKLILDDWTLGPRRIIGARVNLKANQGYAIRIEYYHAKGDPAIQLRWTRPESEPYYAAAVRAAQKADAVVMVLGLTAALEREQDTSGYVGFYGGDRQSLDLPPVQETLLKAVAKTGKPIVLVLTSGSALSINWANANIPAILQAWYPGEEGGSAVADVLFGDYNPGGKLPITFYKSIDDLPAFEDYSMANRTYRFFKGQPLYAFGYGLSYTKFQYSDLQVTPADPHTGADVSVKVTVKNVGERAGDEVVELYTKRVPHLEDAPLKSLEGFLRVPLKAGEEKTVQFTLTPYQLAEISKSGEHENSPGEIEISLPSNAGTLTKTIALTGETAKPDYRFVPPKIIQPAP